MVHPNSSTDPLHVQVLCAYAHFYKEHIYIYIYRGMNRGMSSSFKRLLNLPLLVVKGQWLFSDVDVCNLSPCTVCIVQVLQKVIPRNPPDNFLPDTEYTCTLYNLAGNLTAAQSIIYEGTYVGLFYPHALPTNWCALYKGVSVLYVLALSLLRYLLSVLFSCNQFQSTFFPLTATVAVSRIEQEFLIKQMRAICKCPAAVIVPYEESMFGDAVR